jgi:transcriptional regulator with XRE-family HTH domain
MGLGKEIERIRSNSRHVSRAEFARAVDISREALRKIENEAMIPRRELLDRILDVAAAPASVRERACGLLQEARAKRAGLENYVVGVDKGAPGEDRTVMVIVDATMGYLDRKLDFVDITDRDDVRRELVELLIKTLRSLPP